MHTLRATLVRVYVSNVNAQCVPAISRAYKTITYGFYY